VRDYVDRITRKLTARVTTGQIYWGAVPFVLLQIVMVALIIGYPSLIGSGATIARKPAIEHIRIDVPPESAADGAQDADLARAFRRAESF
jgi:hypothetical protein